MDNFTHSLAGWALSQAGLKRKTGLATATLIIAANLPDIDAVATLLSGHQHLAIRRGITHGPIAMIILPILLTFAMMAFDRWQAKRGKRPDNRAPIRPVWLLALAFIGTWSHPALDLMNSYGVRLLEPFSSQWYYGDTLFIIDVWLWLMLPLGIWYSRTLEKRDSGHWRTPALAVIALALVYIQGNGWITKRATLKTAVAVTLADDGNLPEQVIANPVPVKFWQRDMLWRQDDGYGTGEYSLQNGVGLSGERFAANMDDPLIETARQQNPDLDAFLFWSRMPFATVEKQDGQTIVTVRDVRFIDPLLGDRFSVKTVIAPEAK